MIKKIGIKVIEYGIVIGIFTLILMYFNLVATGEVVSISKEQLNLSKNAEIGNRISYIENALKYCGKEFPEIVNQYNTSYYLIMCGNFTEAGDVLNQINKTELEELSTCYTIGITGMIIATPSSSLIIFTIILIAVLGIMIYNNIKPKKK